MTFEHKKDLIDSLIFFNLNDILILSNILSSPNLQIESSLEGKELLKSLASILFNCYNSEIYEDKKITFYYYYHKIENELKSISEDEQEAENEEDEEDSIYNAKDRKEIEKQKGFVDRVVSSPKNSTFCK